MDTVDAADEREHQFAGTDRFQVVRHIGSGAHGWVYEVVDRHRGERLALKHLGRTAPAALLRFKQEFRALAGVTHPNLLALHELFGDGASLFFTMELAALGDLSTWLRRGPAEPDRRHLQRYMAHAAGGLAALHGAGRLHRDVKPENILVVDEGRAVLGDFGLVVRHAGDGPERARFAGTMGFVAPEVMAGSLPTPAADWWSFGACLRAVAGQDPALGALAEQLQHEDPRRRPPADQILRTLREDAAPAPARPAPGAPGERREALIGRERELLDVLRAQDVASRGSTMVVRVHGGSGVGKSTLIGAALVAMEQAGAIVLRGRAYPSEAIPFRALDAVMDGLAQRLQGRRDLPGASRLSRLFPVLQGVAAMPLDFLDGRDRQDLRQLAVGELRSLLTTLGRSAPVVLFVDDAQWADPDSLQLLEGLLASPPPPRLLVITADRSESGGLVELWERLTRTGRRDLGAVDLDLKSLGQAEVARFCAERTGGEAPLPEEVLSSTEGNLLALSELAEGFARGERHASFADLISSRLAGLSGAAGRLMEVLAVAGHPVHERILTSVLGPGTASAALVRELHGARLVVSLLERGARVEQEERVLEPRHDLIAASIRDRLPAGRDREIHAAMAQALDALGHSKHLVVEHARLGCLERLARDNVLPAAREAEEALAFDRAARLYTLALELGAAGAEPPDLYERRGRALASSGRSGDAAPAFRSAFEALPPGDRGGDRGTSLRALAAEHALRAGSVDEGMQVMATLLAELGLHASRTRAGAVLHLLWLRVRLTLLRRFQAGRSGRAISRIQLDSAWAATVGFSMVDAIRGAEFQALTAVLALSAADPASLARGISTEASYLSSVGGRQRWALSEELSRIAEDMAQKSGEPVVLGYVLMGRGVGAFFAGQMERALEACDAADETFRRHALGHTWERVMTGGFAHAALAYLGNYTQLAQRTARLLAEIDSRGDVFGSTTLRLGMNGRRWLALDRPDAAERDYQEAMSRWPLSGYHSQDYMALVSNCELDLYRGQAERALERLREDWPRLRWNLFLTREFVRVELAFLRGRACLVAAGGAAARPRDRARWIRQAASDARSLERSDFGTARPWAAALRAGIARREADRAVAAERYREAAGKLREEHLETDAAVAEWRAAECSGDAAAARAAADAVQRAGVLDVPRFAEVVVP